MERPSKRVGDVAKGTIELEGNKLEVRDLVDKEFVITAIAEWQGEKGPYLAVAIEATDGVAFFFSSHVAIMRKLRQCMDDLPLVAAITKKLNKSGSREYFDIE